MIAVILAAWSLWIWAPGVRHPDNGAWLVDPSGSRPPIVIPKEYNNEGHCKSSLVARKKQGYLSRDVYGECLPSGTHPNDGYEHTRGIS